MTTDAKTPDLAAVDGEDAWCLPDTEERLRTEPPQLWSGTNWRARCKWACMQLRSILAERDSAQADLAALRAENEKLKAEIATDEQLLAERQRILDAIPCRVHGPSCVPHVLEEFATLKSEREALRAERDRCHDVINAAGREIAALRERLAELRSMLLRSVGGLACAYIATHREGWEPGPSTGDAIRRLEDEASNVFFGLGFENGTSTLEAAVSWLTENSKRILNAKPAELHLIAARTPGGNHEAE